MTRAIDQLRTVLGYAPPFDSQMSPRSLPQDELRLTLELLSTTDREGLSARVAQLLSNDRFVIQPLDAGESTAGLFYVLRFPTLDRVFPQHELFNLAYELADQLGLAGAEPDLGIAAYREPVERQASPAVEAEFLTSICWADGEAPEDLLWAAKTTRLNVAWEKARGEGILIGQPDTGVTNHTELGGGMLDLDRAADIIDGDSDPTDPLSEGAANPGHGTSTASVLASRAQGKVTGAAPAATVVPIRCIEDVKIFNTAPVAAAIAHAVRHGCHVISMSLGGVAGRAMHAAIREAVARDIIVVAASGNCVGIVVWPARYQEVVAVGGVGPTDSPWKGSSRGSSVTISAPAEFVWRAERSNATDPLNKVSASQGTSYATALVAGAAAVWLSSHGREHVIQEARKRGVTVAALFSTVLKATARVPDGWNEEMGAGILDAEKLVKMALSDIPKAALEAVDSNRSNSWQEDFLTEELGLGQIDASFPIDRFSTEFSAIAVTQARVDQTLRGLSAEAKVEGTLPSDRLREAANSSSDKRLRAFGQTLNSSVSRPLLPTPLVDLTRLRMALPKEAIPKATSGGVALESARAFLADDRGLQFAQLVERIVGATLSSAADKEDVLGSVDKFKRELVEGRQHTPQGRFGLEALILLSGRPALPIRGGSVDEKDPRVDEWGYSIYMLKSGSQFEARLGAVGRIDWQGSHCGTGYVVGEGLILTNRHVLQLIAFPIPQRNCPAKWILKDDSSLIDFAEQPTVELTKSKFRIVEVLEAGPLNIDFEAIDINKPDFALLRVEAKSLSANSALPRPIEVSRSPGWIAEGKELAVIGYPARPGTLPRTSDGAVDDAGLARLQSLFDADYGTKFFSPGKFMAAAIHKPITCRHDATTLGGSSGSLVASIDAPLRAVGLHFGGAWRSENYAHGVSQLLAAGFLKTSGINWVA